MTKSNARKPKFRVLTWDMDLQKFTPQRGVRSVVFGLGALKRALRALQDMGYSCHRCGQESDPAVLVEQVEV